MIYHNTYGPENVISNHAIRSGEEPTLVPRPCAFVTGSAKFAQNFVLQVTNAQGLGTRLEEPGYEASN